MDDSSYREFLRRADAARTVRELRTIAEDALAQFPRDPGSALVRDTCTMYAQGILNRIGVERERRASAAEHARRPHDAGNGAGAGGQLTTR